MGVSLHYWAVPPSSGLFKRLQSDRAFVTLMRSLFCYGGGIFFFLRRHRRRQSARTFSKEVISAQEKRSLGLSPSLATDRGVPPGTGVDPTGLAHPGVEHPPMLPGDDQLPRRGAALAGIKSMCVRTPQHSWAGLLYGDQVHSALKRGEVNLEEFSQ